MVFGRLDGGVLHHQREECRDRGSRGLKSLGVKLGQNRLIGSVEKRLEGLKIPTIAILNLHVMGSVDVQEGRVAFHAQRRAYLCCAIDDLINICTEEQTVSGGAIHSGNVNGHILLNHAACEVLPRLDERLRDEQLSLPSSEICTWQWWHQGAKMMRYKLMELKRSNHRT
jgi:hypothetical protein